MSNKNMLQFFLMLRNFFAFEIEIYWNYATTTTMKSIIFLSRVSRKKYLPLLNKEIKTFACVYASASFYFFSFSLYSKRNFLNAKSCCLSIILISATMYRKFRTSWRHWFSFHFSFFCHKNNTNFFLFAYGELLSK